MQLFKKIIIKFFPIKKNRLVFTSFNGRYSDNPRYISESIHKLYPGLEIVWLLENSQLKEVPSYVKKIRVHSFLSCIYEGSARAIIDNVYGNRSVQLTNKRWFSKLKYNGINFLNKKKGQEVFSTWHGTPLKRMGRDQVNNTIIDFDCPNTTMIVGNQYTLDIMEYLNFGKVKMEIIGTPRNDLLFDNSLEHKKQMKKKLQLPLEKKIILFAPTFRTNSTSPLDKNIQRSGIDQLNILCLDQLFATLSKKFTGDWVLVCRFHYHVDELIDWEDLNDKYDGKVINGNVFDEMSEYLCCCDILLTDASSCMFDFSLTKRPCFLFFPDVKFYESEERGFYLPINELPFSLSKNSYELIENIKKFEWSTYENAVNVLMKKLKTVDQSNSSDKVANFIFSKLYNEENTDF